MLGSGHGSGHGNVIREVVGARLPRGSGNGPGRLPQTGPKAVAREPNTREMRAGLWWGAWPAPRPRLLKLGNRVQEVVQLIDHASEVRELEPQRPAVVADDIGTARVDTQLRVGSTRRGACAIQPSRIPILRRPRSAAPTGRRPVGSRSPGRARSRSAPASTRVRQARRCTSSAGRRSPARFICKSPRPTCGRSVLKGGVDL